jgi:hypothetical protein
VVDPEIAATWAQPVHVGVGTELRRGVRVTADRSLCTFGSVLWAIQFIVVAFHVFVLNHNVGVTTLRKTIWKAHEETIVDYILLVCAESSRKYRFSVWLDSCRPIYRSNSDSPRVLVQNEKTFFSVDKTLYEDLASIISRHHSSSTSTLSLQMLRKLRSSDVPERFWKPICKHLLRDYTQISKCMEPLVDELRPLGFRERGHTLRMLKGKAPRVILLLVVALIVRLLWVLLMRLRAML